MFKDIYEELSYKFKHLPELKPQHLKTRINSSALIDDDFVHEISPERYSFYIEFQKALKDPDVLKDLIYEYKMIKNDKEEENKIINKIVSKINQLYVVSNDNIINNTDEYVKEKNKLLQEESHEIGSRMKNIIGSEVSDNDEVGNIIYSTFTDGKPSAPPMPSNIAVNLGNSDNSDNSGNSVNLGNSDNSSNSENNPVAKDKSDKSDKSDNKNMKGGRRGGGSLFDKYKKLLNNESDELDTSNDKDPYKKKTYMNQINAIKQNFNDSNHLARYRKTLKNAYDEKTSNKIKAQKLKDIVSDIENDEIMTIDNLKISKEDKLVFIGVTFVIRQIVLWLLDWALITNFVTNFTKSFMLYIFIYTLLLLIIVAVVNITYNMPILDLYTGSHGIFTSLASTFYYFYFIPGNELRNSFRILFHLGLMYFIVAIALLVKEREHAHKDGLSYDYVEKKRILRVVSDFTLIIWIFTSILSMYIV